MFILDAVHMITSAWNNVSKACIFNCFKKAGFLKVNHDEVSESVAELEEKDEFYEEFSEWINIDETVCTTEEITDHELVGEIKKIWNEYRTK